MKFRCVFSGLVVILASVALVDQAAAQSGAGCGCQPTTTYYAPVPAVVTAPTVSYYAPAPAVSVAPTVTYYAPAPTVAVAPTTAYYAPTTTYYAPAPVYTPPVAAYYPPVARPLFPYAGWRARRAYWNWVTPSVTPY